MFDHLRRQRAFLLQIGEIDIPDPTKTTGRIEHIESGRSTRFASIQECLDFVLRVLEQQKRDTGERSVSDNT